MAMSDTERLSVIVVGFVCFFIGIVTGKLLERNRDD